jgi:hypothetical protein
MAISPNVDFVAGAILTATQQNQFPRGIMAQASSTTSVTGITSTEAVTLTASTFTAVANRYYRITYIEPSAEPPNSVGGVITAKIRLTNATGTTLGSGQFQIGAAALTDASICVVALATFSAGSVVVVGTGAVNAGTGNYYRSATQAARIIVEDVGPA